MNKKIPVGAALAAACMMIFSCGEPGTDQPEAIGGGDVLQEEVRVPSFNQDSAYMWVKKQVEFGPRIPNTPAHDSCAAWLKNELSRLGWQTSIQEADVAAFDNTRLRLRNIIASLLPEKKDRVLLMAHYDTRPWADQDTARQQEAIDGANDGASGVGVLLEAARVLAAEKPGIGVDIIFFDGEDYGQPEFSNLPKKNDTYCLGAQYWARNPHKPDYFARYGILLDMVGATSARFAREGTSMYYAESIVNKVWNAAAKAGYSDRFIYRKSGAITDDHQYINAIAHIPTIDIIEYDENSPHYFGSYWHTHADNMEVIDPLTLKAVGQTLLEVLYREK